MTADKANIAVETQTTHIVRIEIPAHLLTNVKPGDDVKVTFYSGALERDTMPKRVFTFRELDRLANNNTSYL